MDSATSSSDTHDHEDNCKHDAYDDSSCVVGVLSSEVVVAAIAIFDLSHILVSQADVDLPVDVIEGKSLLILRYKRAELFLSLKRDNADGSLR